MKSFIVLQYKNIKLINVDIYVSKSIYAQQINKKDKLKIKHLLGLIIY